MFVGTKKERKKRERERASVCGGVRMSDLCLCHCVSLKATKFCWKVTKRHKLHRDREDTECDDNLNALSFFIVI